MSDELPKDYERGEAVVAILRRGADFTRQLLEENRRLRQTLQSQEERHSAAARDPEEWEKLRQELVDKICSLETEHRNVLERLELVESENQHFADRYVEVEEENNNLANLYVASYQLHSTLDPGEVLKVIIEIVINLIGAEIFCIYALDEAESALEPVAAEGGEPSDFPRVLLREGFVGESVASGEVATQDGAKASPPAEAGEPAVCIPLRVDEQTVGAIAIYKLLQQKSGFSELDRELFTLLAGHAATAIVASRLHSHSERKLNTIQGFIDLLTK